MMRIFTEINIFRRCHDPSRSENGGIKLSQYPTPTVNVIVIAADGNAEIGKAHYIMALNHQSYRGLDKRIVLYICGGPRRLTDWSRCPDKDTTFC